MRDEDQRQVPLRLKAAQHLDDHRLYRHVQRRGDLVADQQHGVDHERSGDRDPLALAARELVGEARHELVWERKIRQRCLDSSFPIGSTEMKWCSSGCAMI